MKINLRYQIHQSKQLSKSLVAIPERTKGGYSPVFLFPTVMTG